MSEFNGNYIGIVIQNDDPDKMGRVKVFVPHVSPSVYVGWNNIEIDKRVKFLGLNLKSDLSLAMFELKMILPWAELALPISGDDVFGRYNAMPDIGSLSESPVPDPLTVSHNGAYLNETSTVVDAFAERNDKNSKINPSAYAYNRKSYSSAARGDFGIPAVGSKVWVFFQGGDPLYPVVFATSHSAAAWHTVMDTDYPGGFENNGKETGLIPTPSNTIQTGKKVISQRAGSLEFINTTGKEKVILGHKDGSFIELGTDATIEYNTLDKSILTRGDKFETIINDSNLHVNGETTTIVDGNVYETIGTQNKDAVNAWRLLMQQIHEVKMLFDTKRANAKLYPIKLTSAVQFKVGVHSPCPVCAQGKLNMTCVGTGFSAYNNMLTKANSFGDILYTANIAVPITAVPLPYPVTFNCISCGGTGISPSTEDGVFTPEPLKLALNAQIAAVAAPLVEAEQKMGKGGSKIVNITKDKVENIGIVVNDFAPYRLDETGTLSNCGIGIVKEGTYVLKKGTPLFEYVNPVNLPGGNYNLNVANSYTLNVGAAGMSLKTIGNADISGGILNINGLQTNINSKHQINITSDKIINIKSDTLVLQSTSNDSILANSNFDINGNLIVGKSAYISNELYVNHISAPLEMQQTEKTTVYAKPVTRKKIGTAYIEVVGKPDTGTGSDNIPVVQILKDAMGPIGLPTVTALVAPQILKVTVWGDFADEDSVLCYDHSHHFANIPLKLYSSNSALRTEAKTITNKLYDTVISPKHERKS